MGAQVPVLSPNDHPHPSRGRPKGFAKSQTLNNLPVTPNAATQTTAILQFWGCWGAYGMGYMGLAATTWVLKYPYCHQIITQTRPRDGNRVSQEAEL